jgi:hypothetical protein
MAASFNKLIFHFEIAATVSLSPLLFPVDLRNLLERSSYSPVPFHPEKMTSYSEEQAKINLYFRCKSPHCQRYFSTEFGLKIHRNRLHPDWNSDEGWLVILLLAIQFVLTTTLDPLPHLYTTYSDNLESEDDPSIAVHNNKSVQGESGSFFSL